LRTCCPNGTERGGPTRSRPDCQMSARYNSSYCHWRTKVHVEISRTRRLLAKRQPPSRREGGRTGALSRTLRVFQESSFRAQRLGLRRPSAAFPRAISTCATVNWNCYIPRVLGLSNVLRLRQPRSGGSTRMRCSA
jgi:hypothetical protein